MPIAHRRLGARDDARALDVPVHVFYPTDEPSQPVDLGRARFDVAPDALPSRRADGRPRSVVLLSHGNGGAPLLYRALLMALAADGHVVIAPAHPGNHRDDNGLAGTDENLIRRPQHLRLALDTVAADPDLGPLCDFSRVGAVGHSLGGYSVLALAGGRPWTKAGQRLEVGEPDPRICALALLTPGAGWFRGPGGLSEVHAPVLTVSAGHDPVTPRWNGEAIEAGLPAATPREWWEIADAGHFAFLNPFPPAMVRTDFPPACDPPGFDRAAFQAEISPRIAAWLAPHLEGRP